MGLLWTLSVLLIFWSSIYLINTFLLEFPLTSALYAKFLSKNGLSINLFQLKWYTVRCNRLFIKISNFKPNFLKIWFNLGVIIGIIGQIGSVFLLCYTLFDSFKNKPVSEQILVPVLPGVNLPTNQTPYYFVALFICGIVHEFGHAIAASREQVRVNGFGVFLLLIFPGAYVDLCSDHLMIISPIRQLRIFCAGVWHNFVLVLLAVGCLHVHPYIVNTLFDKKAHVGNILPDSPLSSTISINAIISNVANCDVTDSFTYYECLYKAELNPRSIGYCMSVDEIFALSSANVLSNDELTDCCPQNASGSSYCFRWLHEKKQQYSCLPARFATIKQACSQQSDCPLSDKETACISPVFDNSTKLIRIVHDKGSPVLYVGSIKELIYSIQIEDFIPKFKFVPKFLNYQFQLLLKYIVAFSGAIGLLNLVPCFALDGQYILATILSLNRSNSSHHFLTSSEVKRPFLYIIIITIGTILLLLNILVALFSLIVSKTSG